MRMLIIFFLSCLFFTVNLHAQWALDTNGLGNTSEQSLVISGTNIFTGTFNGGVFISTNNGTSWTQTSLNNQFVFSLAANGSNIFAGTYGNGLFMSTNGGTSWTQTTLINQYVISLAASGNTIYAGVYYNGIYLSTNNGSTWNQTALNTGDCYSLAFNGSNIIVGMYLNGVYLSSNNGANWTQTPLNNHTIQSLFLNGSDIFAGTYSSAGIYLSTNGGTSWNLTSLTNKSVYSFAASGNNIFAGSDGYGVYFSTDNGTNWIQRNEGFPGTGNLRVYSVCIFNNYIYAASDYSMFRRPLSDFLGISQISEQVPDNYSLKQNYPNPFNPSTNINFSIVKTGFVKLIVYDITGREIETLVNGQLSPGTYKTDWNASANSSGVYFYRLSAGDYTSVKKMVLVK